MNVAYYMQDGTPTPFYIEKANYKLKTLKLRKIGWRHLDDIVVMKTISYLVARHDISKYSLLEHILGIDIIGSGMKVLLRRGRISLVTEKEIVPISDEIHRTIARLKYDLHNINPWFYEDNVKSMEVTNMNILKYLNKLNHENRRIEKDSLINE